MTDTTEKEGMRKVKTIRGIGLPAGTDYPNIEEIPAEPCKDVFWRKEVANSFEVANNGYSFYRIENSIFAKDLSGYWYRLNNETKCFEFLFEGFKDSTDYTRVSLPPQPPTFVGFNSFHQAVFPMNEDGRPILPKDDKGKTIFPFYEGYPLFPVDDSGAVCVPLGDDGKPVFPRIVEEFGAYVPCDVTGRVVLPLDEQGEPIYPRDEEGNVLMPHIIDEHGFPKRAVYVADDGTPILPFHNGEHAIEVHEGEVLFQHEYQHKMMLLAQFPGQKREQVQLMDEQFYQQHAQQYQMNTSASMDVSPGRSPKPEENGGRNTPTTKNTAQNLLLKQLTFLKKKQETPAVAEKPVKPVVPSERPAKPNKEKEKEKRFIPEPIRRDKFNFRDDRNPGPSSHYSRDRIRERPSNQHRTRSRSLTWSPERKRGSNDRRRSSPKRRREDEGDRRKSSRKEEKSRRKRSSSRSSGSSSANTDYDDDRREKRYRKSEKFRR
ncbi:hypothetical protein CAEBREN_25285 [Caenorhabditis brenneri]|uniref:Uncharacterized protein n=1 Tax=Caenorhabditis brenneri TaxID=135651 RepID=G0P3X0_CAEBE|nr:hypothetical protein CAEBREN_25285 [Caenorhabditis brenneri]